MTEEPKHDGPAGAAPGNGQQQLGLHKVYLKDVSFETPAGPQVFDEQAAPQVNMQLSTSGSAVGENTYEVVLSITVTATAGESTAFLVEIHQAGLFELRGFADSDLNALLGSYCPGVLFPFAREAVADLVAKGGFPQLLLAPVNFDALYAQHLQQQQAASAAHAPN